MRITRTNRFFGHRSAPGGFNVQIKKEQTTFFHELTYWRLPSGLSGRGLRSNLQLELHFQNDDAPRRVARIEFVIKVLRVSRSD